MRKNVIFARDTSEALEIAVRDLGPGALILESRRVRGGIEIVAAIDDESPVALQRRSFNSVMQKFREAPAAGAPPTQPAHRAAPEPPDRIQSVLNRLEHIATALTRTESRLSTAHATTLPAIRANVAATAADMEHLYAALASDTSAAGFERADLVFVHGASGSGKSTAIARIAASVRAARPDRRLHLVTADRAKPGAVRALEHVGRLLNMPVALADEHLEIAGRLIEQGYTVFLDMPSDLQASLATARTLLEGRMRGARVVSCVAVESSCDTDACATLLQAARDVAPDVIITKTDEFRPSFSLLSTLARCGARILAFCDGGRTLARPRLFTRATLDAWLVAQP